MIATERAGPRSISRCIAATAYCGTTQISLFGEVIGATARTTAGQTYNSRQRTAAVAAPTSMQVQADEDELGLSTAALAALKEFALENNLLGEHRDFWLLTEQYKELVQQLFGGLLTTLCVWKCDDSFDINAYI